MQEKYLYEYAVIRLLPKVEREEFINVGLIMFCKKAKFLHAQIKINEEKFKTFDSDINFSEFVQYLDSFIKISEGEKTGGIIATYDIPDRFRWLTAVRSSCIQTSRPHVGLSENLNRTFQKLFIEQVL